ncbi:hypothetical protein BOTCAL_1558g00010 [Botryotinia calthae]|uniref:Uncharacterized protein n=1 Tax=Botryotinia calthae TaxID=38488 RepID=A0A4Y8CBF3_9HELO|nr:hypothetical protein BOTCAL_1558g00010 [Botryotinia calthae]
MMCPKKYAALLKEEDYYRSQYSVIITLKVTDAPDTIHYSDRRIHTAIMKIHGSHSVFADAPEFKSDEDGAFYTQSDAMLNARIKLIDWFKDMEAKDLV